MSSETRPATVPAEGAIEDADDTAAVRCGEWLLLIVFLAAAIAAVAHAAPLQSANDRSRWCTVWSLVERGTFQIDEIDSNPRWSSIDKVRHRASEQDEWHFYSSKPPLLSTMVAGLYWLEVQTLGWRLGPDTALVTRVLLIFVNVLPYFFALVVLRRFLRSLQCSPLTRLLVLATAAFGSMLLPFLTTLNNHTPAAICALLAVPSLLRIADRTKSESISGVHFAVLGCCAALTACFELPAALFGVLAFVAAARSSVTKTLSWFVPAALIPLAAFFITNWICTGGIKPFYAYYGTDKYVYVHEGTPSYWTQPRGIDANEEPPWLYAFHCTFGHHGVFSLSPVLLLTVIGWWLGLRRRNVSRLTGLLQPLLLLGLGLSVVVFGFYLTRTQNYNYGGNTAALRWLLWLSPFWWVAMIPACEALWSLRGTRVPLTIPRWGRWGAGLLLAVSVFSAGWSLETPWRPGWLMSLAENAGWVDYGTPPPPFEAPRRSVIGSLPSEDGTWVRYVSRTGTDTMRLELRRTGERTEKGIRLVQFEATLTLGEDNASAVQHQVLVYKMAEPLAGRAKLANEMVLVQPDSTDDDPSALTDEQRQYWYRLLRGLPSDRPYQPGGPAWIRTPLRTDAFACVRAASRVRFRHPQFGVCWQRCDVDYAEDIPFGTLRWKTSVAEAGSGRTISTQTWQVEAFEEPTAEVP